MKQIICTECRGHGIVKMVAIPCECCGGRGKFCMHCENKSGFLVRPFEECEKCYGKGYFDKNKGAKKEPEKINQPDESIEESNDDAYATNDKVNKLKNNKCEII